MAAPSKASFSAVKATDGSLKRPREDPGMNSRAVMPKIAKHGGHSAVKSGSAVPTKAAITKSAPGKASGLSAKMPAATPPLGSALQPQSSPPPMGKRPSSSPSLGNGAGSLAKKMNSGPMPPGVEDGSAATINAIRELLAAMEAAPIANRARDAARLANAVGQTFQIEHLNTFLKVLRRKIGERALREGLSPPQAAKAAQPSAPPVVAQSTTPMPPPTPAVVKGSTPAPPTTPAPSSAPHVAKQSVPKQAVAKQAVAKQTPGALAKSKSAAELDSGQVAKPKPPTKVVASPPPASTLSESDGDPLYVLVGELTQDPVSEDGVIKDARLGEVLRRLWDGVVKKPRDWVVAWQAMGIPVERQVEALQKFLNLAFVRTEDPEKAPSILAELVKGHKIKMRSVEEVLVTFGSNLDGILAVNEDAWQLYAKFLVQVFPKASNAGWGWSRVGWSWQSWWQFVEKCVQSLDPPRAFEVIALTLQTIQDREGATLSEMSHWTDGDRLQRVLTKLCELGGCDSAEVIEQLSQQGIQIEVP